MFRRAGKSERSCPRRSSKAFNALCRNFDRECSQNNWRVKWTLATYKNTSLTAVKQRQSRTFHLPKQRLTRVSTVIRLEIHRLDGANIKGLEKLREAIGTTQQIGIARSQKSFSFWKGVVNTSIPAEALHFPTSKLWEPGLAQKKALRLFVYTYTQLALETSWAQA